MPFSSETIVVIPTMNRATLVVNALDAILKQTLQPDCLVVVDDGSTDNSVEVIRDWKTRTNLPFETKLIALPYNMGVSVARNIGFAQARSNHRYVYFLDSDDIPPPHFLQHTTAALNQRPDAIAVTTDRFQEPVANFSSTDYPRIKTTFYSSVDAGIIKTPLPTITFGMGWISPSLWRTSAVRQSGGFNETYLEAEDDDFYLRLFHLGHWLYIPTCPVLIHRHKQHLSLSYSDSRRRHAHLYETYVMKNCEKRRALSLPELNTFLALYWQTAGWQMFTARNNRHNMREIIDCVRRAQALIFVELSYLSKLASFLPFMLVYSLWFFRKVWWRIYHPRLRYLSQLVPRQWMIGKPKNPP